MTARGGCDAKDPRCGAFEMSISSRILLVIFTNWKIMLTRKGLDFWRSRRSSRLANSYAVEMCAYIYIDIVSFISQKPRFASALSSENGLNVGVNTFGRRRVS